MTQSSNGKRITISSLGLERMNGMIKGNVKVKWAAVIIFNSMIPLSLGKVYLIIITTTKVAQQRIICSCIDINNRYVVIGRVVTKEVRYDLRVHIQVLIETASQTDDNLT